jgi:peroxiredoxin
MFVLEIDNDEPAVKVAAFMEEYKLKFPALLDPGSEVQKLYRVRGYPSSVFIGADGVIRGYHIGVMTEKELDGYLEQIGIGA